MGAPRTAHNVRKVSESVGRPPPRKEAPGWPAAHLAWADLKARHSGLPAAPRPHFLLLGPRGRAPWDTGPGWGAPRLTRPGMVCRLLGGPGSPSVTACRFPISAWIWGLWRPSLVPLGSQLWEAHPGRRPGPSVNLS